jgi:hypothetical protein
MKLKMVANAASAKEHDVFKQSCNPLSVRRSASSETNMRPVMEWMINWSLVSKNN